MEHPYVSNWTLICTGTRSIPQNILDYNSDTIELIRRGIDDHNSNVLIVHMTNTWSKMHLESSRDEITQLILEELRPINAEWFDDAGFHAHRWRFSRPSRRADRLHHKRISFAGDAWSEPVGTVEAAMKSAEFAALELVWKLHYNQVFDPISLQTTLF